jgi:hypothetical protein
MLTLVAVDLLLDAAKSHIGYFLNPSPYVEHLLFSHELLQPPKR